MSKRVEAWLFYKIKDLHTYSEDEKLFIKDIESLLAENTKLNDTFFGNIADRLAVKNERLLIDCNNLMSENFKLKAREEKLIEAINASISRNVTDLRNVLKELETNK